MILQPCNVELTKVHYYDQNKRSQNMGISSISREVHQNQFNKNMLIKKNIFGHRWVLRINENRPIKKDKSKKSFILYLIVFFSIVVAVTFGIVFSIDPNIFTFIHSNTPNILVNDTSGSRIFVPDLIIINKESSVLLDKDLNHNINYCPNCTTDQICLKTGETERPKCVLKRDKKDPTGCAGHCKINKEYCKKLDKDLEVFQCLLLKNLLRCPESSFNCGHMCISLQKRCDGRVDCLNMEDEVNCDCNLDDHFQCGNKTSCLHKSKKCNGKVDCWDKSDEIHCQTDIFCEENQVPCLDGQCIPKDKMCDRVFDCFDKTDEPVWCQEIRH